MDETFSSRTESLLGAQGVALLAQKKVAVFGLGGVGGSACEALARAGIGALDLFDNDVVMPSNLNRQIIALGSTLGQYKTAAMANRIADIHGACQVTTHPVFYSAENASNYPFFRYDYIIDAIDSVASKLEIIVRAKEAGVPVISAMGSAKKLHPERFEIADIHKTSVCPLARIMRRELRKLGITGVKVVYSKEQPLHTENGELGSVSFVPAAAGLLLAGAVIRDLLEELCYS